MDIFTTQLAKVYQAPIKPGKLKVKSLKKEAKSRSLDEEKDHLIGEADDYVENNHPHFTEEEEQATYENPHFIKKKVGSKSAQKNKSLDDKLDDQDTEHFDLYV